MPHGGKRQGAGRPKGAINKVNTEVAKQLGDLGFNPIVEMVNLYHDPEADLTLKQNVCKELAQYIAPKRKSMDVSMRSNQEDWLNVINSSKSDSNETKPEN